jgi:hypothetical protein
VPVECFFISERSREMLTNVLKQMKTHLEAKGISKRTLFEDDLLKELDELDKKLDKESIEGIQGIQKSAGSNYPNLLGPSPNACYACGRSL